MRFFPLGRKSDESIVALFDIGSASVGGAIVRLSKINSPEILYTTRVSTLSPNRLNTRRLLKIMEASVNTIAERLARVAFFKRVPVTKIACVLSSPWYAARTKTFVYEESQNFLVTNELIENLLVHPADGGASKNATPRALTAEIDPDKETVLIEQKIIQVRLNGYETAMPYGKEAKRLEVTVYVGQAPKKIVTDIENTVRHSFHEQEIFFHSFSLASFLSLRDLFTVNDQFLVVHVTGEVTDISVVHGGYFEESVSFPSGRNTILRMLEKTLSSGESEALTLMQFFLAEQEHPLPEKTKNALLSARTLWEKFFTDAIAPVAETSFLCQHIFLIADSDVSEWFAQSLRFCQKEQTKKGFSRVVPLTAEHFSSLLRGKSSELKEETGGEGEGDTAIVMEAGSLGRLFPAHIPLPLSVRRSRKSKRRPASLSQFIHTKKRSRKRFVLQ